MPKSRIIDSIGRPMLYMPNHPKAAEGGFVHEHRVIVEKAYGKDIPPKAEIHHLDWNPQNNAPSNLVLCENREYHRLLHTRTDALNACGNSNWRKCYYCKQYDSLEHLVITKKGFYHRLCKNSRERFYWDRKRSAQTNGKY